MDNTLIDRMFKFVGLNKTKMHNALITLGPKELKPPWKKKWKKENPSQGFCYVVSEFIYYYLAPSGTKVMRIYVPELDMKHWFLQWPDGTVVDLTVDQFQKVPDYSKAKGDTFLTPSPSLRAKKLAELLGFTDEDID